MDSFCSKGHSILHLTYNFQHKHRFTHLEVPDTDVHSCRVWLGRECPRSDRMFVSHIEILLGMLESILRSQNGNSLEKHACIPCHTNVG